MVNQHRLLLASVGLSAIDEFLADDVSGTPLAFISTAGEPHDDRSFVDRDRNFLIGKGFDVQELTLTGQDQSSLRASLSGARVIFVAGGNSFYLLEKALASGFPTVLDELLDADAVYIGASAGAVVVGPDLRPFQSLDDPKQAPDLPSMFGLGLVDFVVLPHYGREKYLPEYNKIIASYKAELNLVPLRDDQAIRVDGQQYTIIDSP